MGSEMCIRDRRTTGHGLQVTGKDKNKNASPEVELDKLESVSEEVETTSKTDES